MFTCLLQLCRDRKNPKFNSPNMYTNSIFFLLPLMKSGFRNMKLHLSFLLMLLSMNIVWGDERFYPEQHQRQPSAPIKGPPFLPFSVKNPGKWYLLLKMNLLRMLMISVDQDTCYSIRVVL